MHFLDLFAGIGGFALGAEWAGMKFDKHYYSEVDQYAIKVYGKRFHDAIGLGDICKIRGSDLPSGEWIIAGGFPCQDISVAGKGAGLAGERSGLWYEYARLIGELRPRYAVMENVGALSFRGLTDVLGSLAEIGYDAEWQDIRASDVGAPHRRERIWIVAYPNETLPSRTRESISGCQRFTGNRDDGSFLADATSIRQQGSWEYVDAKCEEDGGSGEANGSFYGSIGSQWVAEPSVCGMANGISYGLYGYRGRVANKIANRADRLKCLGNSIVPQIAQMIFTEIKRDMEE